MEKLKEIYEYKWPSFYDNSFLECTSIKEKKYEHNPFLFLPMETEISKKELNWLLDEEKKNEWGGKDFYKMRRLRLQKGLYLENHVRRRSQLESVLKQSKNLGLVLPKHFVEFFKTDDYIDRIRFDNRFALEDEIAVFPENKDYFILPFLLENQYCCYWFLLLDKHGNHCILFNSHHWNLEKYGPVGPNDEPFKYYICSYSFEEFIYRLSQDLIKREEERPFVSDF